MTPENDAADVFDKKTQEWLCYVASPAGQLRHIAILGHLRLHISHPPLDILDVGGGTGEQALDLARDGHAVTLLDISPAMINLARSRSEGLRMRFQRASADQIPVLFEPESFDCVLCHSLLEFTSDPSELLSDMMRVLRVGGLLSLVVGNRCHFPLRAALVGRDFRGAQLALDSEPPATDLFGLPRRTYTPQHARRLVRACGAQLRGEYGVRVFIDLLNGEAHLTPELVALELSAGARMPYRHMARFIHFIGSKGQRPWDSQSALDSPTTAI
jgi:S-adenosylmethionine-dependent methyltransferase